MLSGLRVGWGQLSLDSAVRFGRDAEEAQEADGVLLAIPGSSYCRVSVVGRESARGRGCLRCVRPGHVLC